MSKDPQNAEAMASQPDGSSSSMPSIPWEYQRAYIEVLGQVMEGFRQSVPVLGDIRRMHTRHSLGAQIEIRGEMFSFEAKKHEASVMIPHAVVDAMLVEEYIVHMYETADQFIKSFRKSFYEGFEEMTTVAGTGRNLEGKPYSIDAYLDALELIELEFDDEGNPSQLQVIVGPELFEKIKEMTPTPEQEAREEMIIENKRRHWFAKKRYRRLH